MYLSVQAFHVVNMSGSLKLLGKINNKTEEIQECNYNQNTINENLLSQRLLKVFYFVKALHTKPED